MEAKAIKKDAEKKDTRPYVFAVGKRKTAVARVKLFPGGKGGVTVNERELKEYFTVGKDVSIFLAPFKAAEASDKSYDVEVKIVGGGISAGAAACQLGIARALVKEDETRKGILRKAGFLTRDGRTKERKKPGLKRARRAPQWSKR
ncbi:MAG: 30S ribosomal protein S9 [Candidatus Peribacteraceae bacterium]|nr:30S ribosomal protein S9 [Candidatus Peribacteraceae bacterium]